MKILKNITYFIFIFLFTINSSFAIGEYYNNSLLRVDYFAPSANVVKLHLYFSEPYSAPLRVANKQQNEYLVILPEVNKKASGVVNDFSHIYGIVSSKIETIPYSKNGKNGYTKITIKTKNPMTVTAETKILPISVLYQKPSQKIATKPDSTIITDNGSVQDLQQNSTVINNQENLDNQMADLNKITKKDGNLTVEIVPEKTLKTDEKDVLDESGKPQMNYNTLLYALILLILLLPTAKKYLKRLLYLNKIRLVKEAEINEIFRANAVKTEELNEVKTKKDKTDSIKTNDVKTIETDKSSIDEEDIVFEEFAFDKSEPTPIKEKVDVKPLEKSAPVKSDVKKSKIDNDNKVYVISDKTISKSRDLIENAFSKIAESNRRVTDVVDSKATLNTTNPIDQQKKSINDKLDIISRFKIDEDRGFALIKYDNFSALVGYIKDEIFYLKKFFTFESSEISARVNKKILDKTVYMLRVNGYRALYSVDDYKIELMLEM